MKENGNTPQSNPDPQPAPKKNLEVLEEPTGQTPPEEEAELTSEVEIYYSDSIHKAQKKMEEGLRLTTADMAYVDEVKAWKRMPKKWRKKLISIEAMKKEADEASRRYLSLKQWLSLLDLADHVGEKDRIRWVNKTFWFPGGGRIIAHRSLHFGNGKIAVPLPEGLEINEEPNPLMHSKNSIKEQDEVQKNRNQIKGEILSQGQGSDSGANNP